MGYINMKKFNKDKYLKKLRFKKYKRYLYIGIPCILVLLIGIYFAYSKFSVFKEEEVVRTTVGDFISGDAVIGAYIDGEYSNTIPGKNDGYVVKSVSCDNNATGSWDNDAWGIVLTNMTKRTKCNVYFRKPALTETITTAMSNNPSMFASDDADNNVRYIGADPSNYVYFNCSDYNNPTADTCEKWRIIGVFNNVTKSDGSKENLVKIIRADSLGNYFWDYKKKGVGTSTDDYGSNDWTDSQLMMMLNPTIYLKSGYTNSNEVILDNNNYEIYSKMGSYYNGTKGCSPAAVASGASFSCTEVDFTSTGLKNDTTRNAIEEVVWNLGRTNGSTASMSYMSERGTTVYEGHAINWVGKIGLMYPSDYGYASSYVANGYGHCYDIEFRMWGSVYGTGCPPYDYLYNANTNQWTMSDSLSVLLNGQVDGAMLLNAFSVRPALFLKSNIQVDKGTGESSNPYTLKIS